MINKRTSIIFILLTLAVLGLLASQLSKLQFDYELENFFPKNDPDLSYYQKFSKTFGYDNDYLLLGFQSKNGVFNKEFLKSIDSGLTEIASSESTVQVLSPTSIKSIIKTPLGLLPVRLLHLNDSLKLQRDSSKLYQHPLYRGMFISKSGKGLKAIVVHNRFLSKEAADEYVEMIMQVFENQSPRVRVAGKAIAQSAFVNAVKDDFTKFILMAMVLIFFLLLIFMRDLFMITTSLLISGLSVVATIGFIALMGKEIDILSSLIPTILLVVSMSDIIHLFSHIQKQYTVTNNLHESVNHAVRQVGLATLLTSFTTAVGFLTLVTINVKPIIDLGIYAAAGIAFAFIITYLLFPAITFIVKPSFRQPSTHDMMEVMLRKVFLTVVRKTKTITMVTLLLLVIGVIGLLRLQIDAYLVNDLPKNNLVKSDFIYFDSEFSGSKPFTLSLWTKDSSRQVYSREVIEQIDKIERLVKEQTKAGDLYSPAAMVRFANQSLHKGSPDYYKLPETEKEWNRAFRWIRTTHPERRSTRVSHKLQAQISGYFQDLGSRDATIKHNNLLKAMTGIVDQELLGYRLTGTTLLVDKSHALLSTNLIKGLLIAMFIVALIAGWLFKSFRIVVITLIPNIFPILIVSAIMGYFAIPLNLSTSVIFAISFGIVVDDTIHFLSRFKHEYDREKNKVYAIKRAILETGRPILITTIVLTSGFLVFCFSNFSASFYMGLFVSISFIAALFADLYLLPLLLLWWLPNDSTRI
ncbi:MAG: MMPL family transporter [Reichenbachiella sp.]|uniref:efflux RND transporter permease subunit n=1 Tax=Reichenbachiella sp. TaxID=2184521 RepID=UPI0032630799